MKIMLNGEIMDADAGRIDPSDRGFLLGDGVFETIAVHNGAPLRTNLHLSRLRSGLDIIGLAVKTLPEDLAAMLDAVIRANTLTEGALRLTLTRGPAKRGLIPSGEPRPTILVSAAAAVARPDSIAVIVAQSTRRNETSPLCRVKALGYGDNLLAAMEARSAGADDAVLMNTRDRVTGTTIANLFARFGDRIVTPPLADGALPGTVRRQALEILGAAEKSLSVSDLARADEIVITNALGPRRIVTLDGNPIGAGGGPGTMLSALRAALPFPVVSA